MKAEVSYLHSDGVVMFCLSCLLEYQISCCPIEEFEKQLKDE